ncbi:MAG: filamentous hemagglutinin N-terminal domain-containing protein, partial [Leptolyngbyaceae cyanobacterium SL_1_1]|nr:filamentous hemagglutinin N-terminal domain-containing protein [Leptolyngbyaceae cyanobacterium SL_1_1]
MNRDTNKAYYWVVFSLAIAPWLSFCLPIAAQAQSVVPAADGTNTQVTFQESQYDITGGQFSGDGSNLFHSFAQFGIEAGEAANFLSNPAIANIFGRISGGDPSVINGLLRVSGGSSNLFLLNPYGVLFGPEASLDLAGSFAVTTASGIGFDNGWFEVNNSPDYASLLGDATRFAFNTDADTAGSLVNTAELAVAEGQNLSLTGGSVINSGTLKAPGGNITLSAIPATEGGTAVVRISQTGSLLSLDIPAERLQGLPAGASVPSLPELLSAGETGGQIELSRDSQGNTRVRVAGTGISTEPGTVIASGQIETAGENGGRVEVLGAQVGLVAAEINASGQANGGTVLIGGDYQGRGSAFNAEQTYVSADSSISVDSLVNGDGGRAIVWADDSTRFNGRILARGGSTAGNGGLVEVSGRENLGFDGTVALETPNGQPGTLLLDPRLLVIGGVNTDADFDSGEFVSEFAGTDADSEVTADGQILFGDGDPDEVFVISQAAFESLTGEVLLQATEEIVFGVIDNGMLVPDPARPRNGLGNSLSFNGDSLTFSTNSLTTAGLAPRSAPADDPRRFPDFELRTNGAPVTINAFNTGGRGAGRLTIVTAGGDITISSNDVGVPRINPLANSFSLGPLDSSNRAPGGEGGNIEIDINGSLSTFTTEERLTGFDARGDARGGDIFIQATDRIQGDANSSTVDGPAGDITYRSTNTPPFTLNASSGSGTAGNILLEAIGSTGLIAGVGNIIATGAPDADGNPTGNVTLIANEIEPFPDPGAPALIDPVTGDVVVPAIPPSTYQISGVLRLQPFDPGRTIIVGEDIDSTRQDPNALNLTRFELGILALPGNFAAEGIVIGIADNTTSSQVILADPFPFVSPVTIDAGPGSTLLGPTDP